MSAGSRACSQLSQPDECASQMNERQERRSQFVVARGDTSKVFDASEESFDQISVLVKMAIEAALDKPIGAWWNDGLRREAVDGFGRAFDIDHVDEVVGVVSLVGNDGLRREAVDGFGRAFDIGNLTGRENHPQRIAQGIDHDM